MQLLVTYRSRSAKKKTSKTWTFDADDEGKSARQLIAEGIGHIADNWDRLVDGPPYDWLWERAELTGHDIERPADAGRAAMQ